MSQDPGGSAFPITTPELLLELIGPVNDRAWADYLACARPILSRFARRKGVAAHDVDEVVQETTLRFSSNLRDGKYDRSRGSLHGYLLVILTSRIADYHRQSRRNLERHEIDSAWDLPDPKDETAWDEEWRDELQRLLARLRAELSDRTVEAFERYCLTQQPVGQVAQIMGMSTNAVHLCKQRVLTRLREILGISST